MEILSGTDRGDPPYSYAYSVGAEIKVRHTYAHIKLGLQSYCKENPARDASDRTEEADKVSAISC